MTEQDENDDFYLAPQDQRPFGSGITRKQIAFVPASQTESTTTTLSTGSSSKQNLNIGDQYLSIVLGKRKSEATPSTPPLDSTTEPQPLLCSICNQPLPTTTTTTTDTAHDSTIAHQICLAHAHPPSHLDRSNKGLQYLSSYGFDPDDRLGLGLTRSGIRIPIKAKPKYDTVGLREKDDNEEESSMSEKKMKRRREKEVQVKKEHRIIRLNAKEVRKQDKEARKRAERLREVIYGPDLVQYLGPNS